MEKGNTKQQILDVALELFSYQGFEATSISQISEAVGIKKASMYSHFKSKQEILDELVKVVLEEYNKHSIFANSDWSSPEYIARMQELTPEIAIDKILGQLRYILHDPKISSSRKMLTIEQFQNPQLATLQTKQNYTDVLKYFTGLIQFFIDKGYLVKGDAEMLASELCLPITIWINLCDREPEKEEDMLALIERYIKFFFSQNKKV